MQFNVYKLTCNKTGQDYYGSTEDTVKKRLQEHKDKYKSYLKGNHNYCSSFEIIKNCNYKIELLETCFNVYHMIERETYYFDNFECVNIKRPRVPGRTRKEYRETFKEEIAEKHKEWREEHKKEIAEKNKEKYEKNKEKISEKRKETYTCACGLTLTIHNKTRHEKTKKHQDFINKKKIIF